MCASVGWFGIVFVVLYGCFCWRFCEGKLRLNYVLNFSGKLRLACLYCVAYKKNKAISLKVACIMSSCHWRGSSGDLFQVCTGTKQGGVISPRIFTMYMDDLISRLRERGVGCHLIKVFVACLFYADDLCLIAPSRGAMQEMLTICQEYCAEFCLNFNVKKTKVLAFGPISKRGEIAPLLLDSKPIDFVSEWRYLGATIVAGPTLTFSSKQALASFYRAVNSLLSSFRKPDEIVLMHLLYTNCVPILSYGAEVIEFSSTDMRECNIALNDAIRRIYSYNRWESTRTLRQQLGYPNLYEVFSNRRDKFLQKNLNCDNDVILQSTLLYISILLN